MFANENLNSPQGRLAGRGDAAAGGRGLERGRLLEDVPRRRGARGRQQGCAIRGRQHGRERDRPVRGGRGGRRGPEARLQVR